MTYKDIEEFLSNREFSFHRIQTLIVLLIVAVFSLMTVIIPFINGYTENILVHLIVSLFLLLFVFFAWYWNRAVFPKPKTKKGQIKEQIIIAIVTENAKQKVRITTDFKNQIKRQIENYDLGNYDVIVLHNYQSKVLQDRIRLYNESRGYDMQSVDVDKFLRLIQ